MQQEYIYGKEARNAIYKGVELVSNAVKVTLGPRGRNVYIHEDGKVPHNTKDGVTVANSIKLHIDSRTTGAEAIKQAANRANESAGDGTTTATVLASKIIELGLEQADNGSHLVALSRGVQVATERTVKIIQDLSKEVKDKETLKHIAKISANGDEDIATIVSDAVWNAGVEGYVSVEDSPKLETYIEEANGMQIDRGMVHQYFQNDGKGNCVLEGDKGVRVLLWGGKAKSVTTEDGKFISLIQQISQSKQPLLIITDEPQGEFVMSLLHNHMKDAIKVCIVESPAHAEIRKSVMNDIAAYTGANYRSPEQGDNLDSFVMGDLGKAKRVVVSKGKTIIEGLEEFDVEIASRKAQIQAEMETETDVNMKSLMEQRISRLAGKVTKIYVGAPTEIQQKESKDRVVDSLSASKAALTQGYVLGGGYTLLEASEQLDLSDLEGDELKGAQALQEALSEPNRCILQNAGLEYSGNFANPVNAFTGQHCDLFNDGVIDPAKVTQTALEAAASVASTVLTTECIIYRHGYLTS